MTSTFMASALSLLTACLHYISAPVVDMREQPTMESKIVSQALFAEEVQVKEEADQWVYITTPDGYEGWIESNALVTLSDTYPQSSACLQTSRLAAHLYGVKDTEYGPILTLPYGSKLQVLDDNDARWIQVALPNGKEAYIQRGDVTPESAITHKSELVDLSQRFLGLPYTWGGRSSFGYDCSGFIQMLYGQMGVNLERDSKQQVIDERFKTIPVEELEIGDLVFFGKSEQRIMHVGLYIGQGQFIHATARENLPYIRISHLTDLQWSGHPEAYYPYRMARQLINQ